MSENYQVIVIGSGPAGLTAAIYLARARLKTLVLTGNEPGGQLTTTSEVENFPGFPEGISGSELIARMRQQAERFGAQFLFASAKKIERSDSGQFLVESDQGPLIAQALIIATGASARWLGVPGEDRWRGRGVSACATCDGAFFKDKTVAVIGGGNTALTEAEFLTRFAQKVFLIHRRENYRAEQILIDRIRANAKIIPLFNTQVKEFLGEEKLTGLRLESTLKVETGEYAEEIAQYPKKFGGDSISSTETFQWQLAVDGVFVAIGHQPNTEFLKGFLERDERGYLKTRDGVFTSMPGVFAAGDCADFRYQQAITAAGLGCQAALEAERFLSKT